MIHHGVRDQTRPGVSPDYRVAINGAGLGWRWGRFAGA
jgi:hypothetical protein